MSRIRRVEGESANESWRNLHENSIVWLLHDHFFHRLDESLAMQGGGVTAKTLVPVGDLAIYNDGAGEDDRDFYVRSLEQTDGWARESLVRLERARSLLQSRPDRFIIADEARGDGTGYRTRQATVQVRTGCGGHDSRRERPAVSPRKSAGAAMRTASAYEARPAKAARSGSCLREAERRAFTPRVPPESSGAYLSKMTIRRDILAPKFQ